MRRSTLLAAAAVLTLFIVGCGSSSKTSGSGDGESQTATVTLTKAGCDPAHLEVSAGKTTFEITNDGASAVTEMEVEKDGKVLGEVENITPGLSGSFTVTLEPGTYEMLCPGGKTDPKGELVVTGS